jgi:uncharacterized protein (TIGR02147 family)
MNTNPDIFTFLNYREFLKAFVAIRKEARPGFSIRGIAYRLGCDPGFFNRVFNGKRNLNEDMALKLAPMLGLGKREQRYFELLVRYNQARNQTERDHYFEQLEVYRSIKIARVAQRQYRLYTHWYYTVIREMLSQVKCRAGSIESAKRISALLQPWVPAAEIAKVFEALEEEGIIQRENDGTLRPSEAFISSGTDVPAVVVNRVLQEFLDRSKEALERVPRSERTTATLTFSVSQKGVEKIRRRLEEQRREILAIVNEDADPADRVYHLNMNLFPVTKNFKDPTP